MTNNCPNCDKPGCQAASLDALYQAIDPWRRPADLAHKRGAAIALCGANRVDWRARALTEAARADSAEARIAKIIELATKQVRLLWDAGCDEHTSWKEGQSDAGYEILEALGAKP